MPTSFAVSPTDVEPFFFKKEHICKRLRFANAFNFLSSNVSLVIGQLYISCDTIRSIRANTSYR